MKVAKLGPFCEAVARAELVGVHPARLETPIGSTAKAGSDAGYAGERSEREIETEIELLVSVIKSLCPSARVVDAQSEKEKLSASTFIERNKDALLVVVATVKVPFVIPSSVC